MGSDLEIRDSEAVDLDAIESLYREAFPDEDLLPLVRSLLPDTAIATSLVAAVGDQVVGHVVFTICGMVEKNARAALLGPLGVLPAWHGQGIGSALVRTGLLRMTETQVRYVCVLGDPAFYGRLGFRPESSIQPPFRLPPEYEGAWQSQKLGTFSGDYSGKLSVPRQWDEESLWVP
ncbi:MAG: N-acetyltransferase [Burkholderiaceae bacterium]